MLSLLLSGNRELGIKEDGDDDFAFQIDAVLEERHELKAQVTRFPTEDGVEIGDHILNEPEQFIMRGFVTNTQVLILGGLSFQDRVQTAFDALNLIWTNKILATVVSELKVYTGMAMVNLTIPRGAKTGQALEFSATFQKLIITDVGTTGLPLNALPEQNVGLQGAEDLGIYVSLPSG